MNKRHQLAYVAIKEVSQGKRGALTKLLAVVGVSRQAYYKGLKREETAWEVRDRQLKERIQYWFDFHHQGIGAGNLLVNLQHDESITFEVTYKMVRRVMRELGLRCQIRVKKHSRQKASARFCYISDSIHDKSRSSQSRNRLLITILENDDGGANGYGVVKLGRKGWWIVHTSVATVGQVPAATVLRLPW